jgi:AraC-like DNA-binding protein
MTHFYNALPFVDSWSKQRMSSRFKRVLDSTEVELDHETPDSRLSIRAAALDDWWFSAIEGSGSSKINSDHRAFKFTNHALLLLTLRGALRMENSKSIFPPAGQISLLSWERKDATISAGPYRYVCAYLPLAHLEAAAGGADKVPFGHSLQITDGAGSVIFSSLIQIVREATTSPGHSNLTGILPAFTQMAVSALIASAEEPSDSKPHTLRINKIQAYLSSNFDDPQLSADRVAEALGISRRQLCREYESVGESYSMQLRSIRIRHAKWLLQNQNNYPITRIAMDCGFNCPTVFGRLFKAAVGVTPKEYRAGIRHPKLSQPPAY